MNFKWSKTSDGHKLLHNLTDKIYLKKEDKYITLLYLSIYYTWKNIKKLYKNDKCKTSALKWNLKNPNYQIDSIPYQIFKIILNFEYILKIYGEEAVNSSITTYVNNIENRITFKMKTGYYLENLTPETKKLLGSIRSKITKNKNSKNAPNLKITELALVHCNIVNKKYQRSLRVLYALVSNKSFGQLLSKDFIFLKNFDS